MQIPFQAIYSGQSDVRFFIQRAAEKLPPDRSAAPFEIQPTESVSEINRRASRGKSRSLPKKRTGECASEINRQSEQPGKQPTEEMSVFEEKAPKKNWQVPQLKAEKKSQSPFAQHVKVHGNFCRL